MTLTNIFKALNTWRASDSVASSVSRSSRSGIAAVEFAIILPVALLLVLGSLQSAQVFYLQKHLLAAAQSATRTGTIQGSTEAQVKSALSTYLSVTDIGADYQSTITGVGTTSNGDSLVTVQVTHNVALFAEIPAMGWSTPTIPISASVTMRHE